MKTEDIIIPGIAIAGLAYLATQTSGTQFPPPPPPSSGLKDYSLYHGNVLGLHISQQAPTTGDVITITIDNAPPQTGIEVYEGGRPGMDNKLVNPQLISSGYTTNAGTYSVQVSMTGSFNQTLYYQAQCNGQPSNKTGLTIVPPLSIAKWSITPTQYIDLTTGVPVTTSRPLENCIKAAASGDVMVIESGQHPKADISKKFSSMTWVLVRDPPNTQIGPHTVGGSSTIYFNGASNITFVNLNVHPSDVSAILSTTSLNSDIHFYNLTIDGHWDWYTGTGYNTKWGFLGNNFTRSGIRNAQIINIFQEHAHYGHNYQGDNTYDNYAFYFEDVNTERLGRTSFQLVARASEGPEGGGLITLRNVRIRDVCLEQSGGGSAITFAGRHRGNIIVDNIDYASGFDTNLNTALGKIAGTGCFVSHFGGGSNNVNNGPIWVSNSNVTFAPGGGDRSQFEVDATDLFTFYNTLVTVGKTGIYGLSMVTSSFLSEAVLDVNAPVSGRCSLDGIQKATYADLIADYYG